MSTLSEHTGNGNPPATRLQREDTKERIDGVLQNFDVLPSRFDQSIFKYIYIYLIGLFFLGELLLIPPFISQPQGGKYLLVLGVSALPVVVILSMIWLFNVWRLSTPITLSTPKKTLRDLLEKKRIYLRNGNANTSYLCFLEKYRGDLASPKRYFLSGFPMIAFGILCVYALVQILSLAHLNMFTTILFVVGALLSISSYVGGLYCIEGRK